MKTLITIFLCILAFSGYTQIIDDNFDSETIGTLPTGWVIKYEGTGTANQKVVNTTSVSPDNSFELQGKNGWSATIIKKPAEIPYKVTLEGYVKAEKIFSGDVSGIGLTDPDTGPWGTYCADVRFYNGKIVAFTYPDHIRYTIQDYNINQWYHIKIEANLINETFEVYIDDIRVSGTKDGTVYNEFPMVSGVKPTHIHLTGGNGGTVKTWFDDVKLYKTPEFTAYYPFNGNANDESGYAHHGTVNGAILTTDRFGNPDSAYYFNGTSAYISVPDNDQINIREGGSYSVSYWIKHDAQNNSKYIISKYRGSIGVEPSWSLGTGSIGDAYSWFEFTAGNGTENRGNIDLNDNKWHNITTVFTSGENIKIFVDGVLDIQKNISYSGSIVNTVDLTIGCGANIAQFYKGSIDDIKIYNYALTEDDIKKETNPLIAYYPFNGNANDESINANHGTVYGATLTADRLGNPDSAYYFDGESDYILCNKEVGPFGNNSRSISFWAKTDVEPNTNKQQNSVISYGGNINDGGSRFEILLNPKCRGLGVDVSSKYRTQSFDNSDNGWHFYTVVFDNNISDNLSDLKFYADAELLTSLCNSNGGDMQINTKNEQVLNIGRLFYSGEPRYFKGSIDEIRIYNKVLTQQEIHELYNDQVAGIANYVRTNKDVFIYNNKLFLKNGNQKTYKELALYNMMGQQIFKTKQFNFPVNLNFLKNGIYIVKLIQNEKGIAVRKFIVQH